MLREDKEFWPWLSGYKVHAINSIPFSTTPALINASQINK